MAKDNWGRSLSAVLANEGGYSNDPRDPGNWTGGKPGAGVLKGTKKGISAKAYPQLDIKALNDNQIAEIYSAKYWRKVRGDELPAGVDFSAFDYAVQSGPSRSAKDLQRVLGVAVDGIVGPATVLAAKTAAPRATIKAHCARRLGFVQSLAIWKTFAKGLGNRVAKAEAMALAMVSSKAQLEADAKAASGKVVQQAGGAGGTVIAGTADQTGHLSGLPIGVVIAAVVVVGGILVIRSIINAQRARALTAVAREA